jgi:hypothetical protein
MTRSPEAAQICRLDGRIVEVEEGWVSGEMNRGLVDLDGGEDEADSVGGGDPQSEEEEELVYLIIEEQ